MPWRNFEGLPSVLSRGDWGFARTFPDGSRIWFDPGVPFDPAEATHIAICLYGVRNLPLRAPGRVQDGPAWSWDGDAERPTLTPSILCRIDRMDGSPPVEVWHGWLRAGVFVSVTEAGG